MKLDVAPDAAPARARRKPPRLRRPKRDRDAGPRLEAEMAQAHAFIDTS